MKFVLFLVSLLLLPIAAMAQVSAQLSKCDNGDKFQRMDCIDKLQKSVESRIFSLENKIVRDLEQLEKRDGEAKSLELSRKFKESQRAWREFTELDCYSLHALPGANGMGGIIRDCVVRRYFLREQALINRGRQ